MKKLTIELSMPPKKTEVIFASPLLRDKAFLSSLEKLSRRLVLITDEKVAKDWKEIWAKKADLSYVIPSGERSKTRKTKEEIENAMLKKGLGKDAGVLALGGGVVTDLAGFVAATFQRGIPLVLVPTSLLGMVDAAIGGKNGVNTPEGKNLIGSFYLPDLIGIDTKFLTTLPKEEIVSGLAEVVKYGLTLDASLFERMHCWETSFEFLEEVVYASVKIKSGIVEQDPQEKKGLRRVLNFGHTFGHALESAQNYRVRHGEAVAVGLLAESFISYKMGHLSKSAYEKIFSFFQESPFLLKCPCSFSKLYEKMARDKKNLSSKPRFVLLEGIGKTASFKGEYCTAVPKSVIEEAFHEVARL